MMDTIWITRHANREDFVDPHWAETADRPHDPDLSSDGVEQARRLGERLSEAGITQIVASPFLRTVHTAHWIAEAIRRPIALEPGLGEWLNADWFETEPETLPVATLADRFPRVDSSYEPCLTPSFPETRHEAFNRCARATWCLIDRFADEEELLLVGHGASVYGVLQGLVRDDVPDADCPLCGLTRLTREGPGHWTIDFRNDTTHLDRAQAGDRFQ